MRNLTSPSTVYKDQEGSCKEGSTSGKRAPLQSGEDIEANARPTRLCPCRCVLSSNSIPAAAPPLSLQAMLSSAPSTGTPAASLQSSLPRRRTSEFCATMPQPFLKAPRRCSPTSQRSPVLSALSGDSCGFTRSPRTCSLPPWPYHLLSFDLTCLPVTHLNLNL